MSERYIIRWVSKVNGRAGTGTKLFDQPEAEQLARELNEDYPQIHHQAVPASSAPKPPSSSEDSAATREHDPTRALTE